MGGAAYVPDPFRLLQAAHFRQTADGSAERCAVQPPHFTHFPFCGKLPVGRNIVCPETALNRFNSLITMADTLLLFHKSYLLSAFVDRAALREIIHWDSHRCQAGIRLPSGSASPTYSSNTGGPASPEIDVLTAVLKVGGSQFCAAEVGADLKQTARYFPALPGRVITTRPALRRSLS